MSGIFASSVRRLRSIVPFGSSDETFGFARFNNEADTFDNAKPSNKSSPVALDTTELTSFHSNGVRTAKESAPTGTVPSETSAIAPLPKDDCGAGFDHSGGDTADKRNLISEWQAGWNVTNAIQGMFIVSFPYTVFEGGYWALVSMLVIAYICCYTGKILVDCLYEDVPTSDPVVKKRVRTSYVDIAETVWGKRFGARIVFVAQLIELLMTCILYVLLCGQLMMGIVPGSPVNLTAWIVISSVLLLPCAFLRSLRHVAWLSFWCTVSHIFINAIIVVYCFTKVHEWKWEAVQIKIDIWTFPLSLGIVVFSYTSQIFLPSLEGNMTDRSKFASMMHWTHFAAAVFKAGFAYIGFVTFGNDTQEVITNNLSNQTMKVIVNAFLVAKALLSYPLPYFATANLIESAFFRGKPETFFPPCYNINAGTETLKIWALVLRIGLVILTTVMAIIIPHFAILMALIGSFTGNMLSLVWPAYFHLSIKGHMMSWPTKLFDICIILLGLTISGLGIYYSSHALVRAFQGFEPRPFQRH